MMQAVQHFNFLPYRQARKQQALKQSLWRQMAAAGVGLLVGLALCAWQGWQWQQVQEANQALLDAQQPLQAPSQQAKLWRQQLQQYAQQAQQVQRLRQPWRDTLYLFDALAQSVAPQLFIEQLEAQPGQWVLSGKVADSDSVQLLKTRLEQTFHQGQVLLEDAAQSDAVLRPFRVVVSVPEVAASSPKPIAEGAL